MNRLRQIFLFISFGLSCLFLSGQQIGNYVNNGSFEEMYNCTTQPTSRSLKYWGATDSSICAEVLHLCWGNMPLSGSGYQNPKHGNAYSRVTLWCPYCLPASWDRSNLRNRLKQPLTAGKSYCVKMWVSTQDACPVGIDGFGFYFGDSSIDTIVYNSKRPLTFLNPQVSNPPNNIIIDSLNWVAITGTFTANGTEKNLIIGNFKSDVNTNTAVTNYIPYTNWSEYYVDAVSCIEYNLSAYAGPDKFCIPGDSVFIGRQPDFATDSGCIWYKLPNMVTSIDTVSGLWVKPVVTTTYVVRQQLDCSPLKWDTVVVFQTALSIQTLQLFSDNLKLFPNPSNDRLNISFPIVADLDIGQITITNNLGQLIREENLAIKNNNAIIETNNLDGGIYQIHFKTKAGTVTKQFVKIN